ncbi:disease resistance-like protein DSC1 [Eucalyptus grandis]|uniref:disease resistance-like protein DSC1 n=1 Tax=Eucalyptus grandis TaxID=71139 RepID=UPI00192EB4ED|nr:disease resistance-like protein DSC1 [Eucalyptus grandis]
MDCHRKHGKSVFPVFYKVDVGDVRRQRTNFEKDLRKPEMQISTEEMERWWDALTSVARIKGWISQTIANGHEAELVKMVVAKVSSELKTMWIERLPMFIRSVHCQVFLAFRGPDTRHSLAAYLYISLVAAGIGVFNDDDPSLIGKDVDHETCNALHQPCGCRNRCV